MRLLGRNVLDFVDIHIAFFFLWTSAMGLLMVTEHMVQLLHLELCDKCVASSMKMQIASSMCSGPTLEEISSLFLISMSKERYNCHMMELAGPHRHVWSHRGTTWVLCRRQCDVPKLWDQGRCIPVPVHAPG